MANQGPKRVRLIAENRKARHEYDILDRVEAGMVLLGSEVKSLRNGKGNIAEAYVRFEDGEAFIVEMHIAPYPQAGRWNHEPRRKRKLLLKVVELSKLFKRVQEKGLTAMPLRLYFDGAWVKLEIGVGRGRKLHDKRAAIKERTDKRDVARALRER